MNKPNNDAAAKIERLTAELEIMTDKREASRRCHLDLRRERDELLGQLEVMTNKHTGRDADVKRLTAERDEARASYQGLVRQLLAGKTLRDLRAEEN